MRAKLVKITNSIISLSNESSRSSNTELTTSRKVFITFYKVNLLIVDTKCKKLVHGRMACMTGRKYDTFRLNWCKKKLDSSLQRFNSSKHVPAFLLLCPLSNAHHHLVVKIMSARTRIGAKWCLSQIWKKIGTCKPATTSEELIMSMRCWLCQKKSLQSVELGMHV